MKNPFFALFHPRDKPQNAVSAAPVFYFGTSISGKTVNPRNSIQVIQKGSAQRKFFF